MDWYPSSKSIETKPLAVIKKDMATEVPAVGAGFDTVIGTVAADTSSLAGIATVITLAVTETGVRMLDPKFTTAPGAKLLPVIARFLRSPLPVRASGGDSRVITGDPAGGGGGGAVTVRNTCPVTEPDIAIISALPAATPAATLPFIVAMSGLSLLN
jgi:hypothetical protein